VEAEAQRPAIANVARRQRRPHPGRQRLSEKLPPCGRSDSVRGAKRASSAARRLPSSATTEANDWMWVPARYFVRVTKREKRACSCCKQGSILMPAREPRIVEKGLASDRVVETVIGKYCDHLPLYRQAAMLEREAGLEIGRATLDAWVMRVGELLEPVVAAMRPDLLRATYLQADIVPVQMHDQRGADHQACLWQYGKPGGETVFDFRMSRGREGPQKFLGLGGDSTNRWLAGL
jgi:transposase